MMQLASRQHGTGTSGQFHALDTPQHGVGLFELTDASDCRTDASAGDLETLWSVGRDDVLELSAVTR